MIICHVASESFVSGTHGLLSLDISSNWCKISAIDSATATTATATAATAAAAATATAAPTRAPCSDDQDEEADNEEEDDDDHRWHCDCHTLPRKTTVSWVTVYRSNNRHCHNSSSTASSSPWEILVGRES